VCLSPFHWPSPRSCKGIFLLLSAPPFFPPLVPLAPFPPSSTPSRLSSPFSRRFASACPSHPSGFSNPWRFSPFPLAAAVPGPHMDNEDCLILSQDGFSSFSLRCPFCGPKIKFPLSVFCPALFWLEEGRLSLPRCPCSRLLPPFRDAVYPLLSLFRRSVSFERTDLLQDEFTSFFPPTMRDICCSPFSAPLHFAAAVSTSHVVSMYLTKVQLVL